MDLLNDAGFFWYHCVELVINPSSSWNGPANSLTIIPTLIIIIISPPPCCRFSQTGVWSRSAIQPQTHQSGPSIDTPAWWFCLWFLCKGGWFSASLHLPIMQSMRHFAPCAFADYRKRCPGRWWHLRSNGFLDTSCLILLKSLVVNRPIFFSTHLFCVPVDSLSQISWLCGDHDSTSVHFQLLCIPLTAVSSSVRPLFSSHFNK